MHTSDTLHASMTESSIDRFARRIASLEGVGHRRRWGVWAAGLALVGGIVVALLLLNPVRTDTASVQAGAPEATASQIGTISMLQPLPGPVAAAPTEFSWEAVQGSSSYRFQLTKLGSETPLVERTVPEARVELTPEESALLTPGQSYVWKITALKDAGTKIAESESYFDV